ncbi:MAG: hypothetical protein RLY15_1566, partial [Bacteroidota bacterium]
MFKLFFPLFLTAFFGLSVKATPAKQDKNQGHEANKLIVPVGGNTWTINGGIITNNGLTEWTFTTTRVQTYIYLSQSGTLHLSLNMNPGGKNKLKIIVQGLSKEVIVEGGMEKEYYVGKWEDVTQGYVMIEMQGVSRSANSFGTVTSFGISGTSINSEAAFVKDNKDNYFYWGRRGPSVHLKYT